MSVKFESSEEILTIYLTDVKILDQVGIENIYKEVIGALEKTVQPNVVIDFRFVKFMSSAALGMLIRVNKKCKEFKAILKLCNISPDIRQVFDITGLNKVFSIHATAEEAREAFKKGGRFFHK
jgi:anti-sigma B factor antagonist